MAACLLRKLGTLQRCRAISQNLRITTHVGAAKRKMHVSAAVLQKYFTDKHEWIDVPEGSKEGTVGITDYAQDKLGDIVFVQLPDVGDELEADGEAGVLESVKAASDIYSPISGKVTASNADAIENPKIINEKPFDEGWLFKVEVTQPNELAGLMSEDDYKDLLKNLE